jgi:DNA-binding response OmpR family regulator
MLIVDDDVELQEALQRSFHNEGMVVDTAENGERGSFLGRTTEYDIIVLDLILPDKDGCLVCTEIRRHGRTCPILMLSVNSTVEQKVRLLNAGADDYIAKPFSFRELAARVRALIRRPRPLESDALEIGDLRIDASQQRVTRGKKEIYLTRKEFLLLEFMMRRRGQVISRSIIMEHVWNADADPFSNTIEAHILNIRRKIADGRRNRLIHTVPGRGYKIDIIP